MCESVQRDVWELGICTNVLMRRFRHVVFPGTNGRLLAELTKVVLCVVLSINPWERSVGHSFSCMFLREISISHSFRDICAIASRSCTVVSFFLLASLTCQPLRAILSV